MTRAVELADRVKVEALRRAYGHELSSHAFASMYLWKEQFGLTLHLEEELFAARMAEGENVWFFPCGSVRAVREFLKWIDAPGLSLRYVRKCDRELLQNLAPDAFDFTPDGDASEYIYEIAGHEALAGKAYANVRTQLHKITREHVLKTAAITADTVPVCMEVLRRWEKKRGTLWAHEVCAVDAHALENRELLGIDGIVVFADGEPAGVAAGYPLTDDTHDLFLAKAACDLPGMSYFVQRSFFLSRGEGVRLINMEEDLGREGLRNMKRRLAPVRMNELWRADKKR